MAASIILRITASPVNGQTQEEADAKLAEVFASYPPEALASTVAADIWTNTDAGWLGLQAEIVTDASGAVAPD